MFLVSSLPNFVGLCKLSVLTPAGVLNIGTPLSKVKRKNLTNNLQ